jgi:hypothetical protein
LFSSAAVEVTLIADRSAAAAVSVSFLVIFLILYLMGYL